MQTQSNPIKSNSFAPLISDILSCTNMFGAKKYAIPLSTSTTLKLLDGSAAVGAKEFRKTVVPTIFSSHSTWY